MLGHKLVVEVVKEEVVVLLRQVSDPRPLERVRDCNERVRVASRSVLVHRPGVNDLASYALGRLWNVHPNPVGVELIFIYSLLQF